MNPKRFSIESVAADLRSNDCVVEVIRETALEGHVVAALQHQSSDGSEAGFDESGVGPPRAIAR